MLTVGVDIGGTKVLAGVVGVDGQVVERLQRRTPHRSSAPAVVADTIVSTVEDIRGDLDIGAVGIGAAGFVDRGGVVRFAPTCPGATSHCRRFSSSASGSPSSWTTTPT